MFGNNFSIEKANHTSSTNLKKVRSTSQQPNDYEEGKLNSKFTEKTFKQK